MPNVQLLEHDRFTVVVLLLPFTILQFVRILLLDIDNTLNSWNDSVLFFLKSRQSKDSFTSFINPFVYKKKSIKLYVIWFST